MDTSLPALRVIRALEEVVTKRGKPGNIRCDNGPEFISHRLQLWCEENQVSLQYIQPGEPTQNAYVERNNGSIRRELLDLWQFTSLKEVRIMAAEWHKDYNEHRPHKALGYLSPLQYHAQWLNRSTGPDETTEALSTSASGGPQRPQATTIVDKVFEKPNDEINQIPLLPFTTN